MSLVTQLTAAFTRVGTEFKSVRSALALKAPSASPTFTGTVTGITASMVGLGNVDNTADANKPVSGPQQTALNTKSAVTLLASGVTAVPAGSPAGVYFFQ